MGLGEMLGVKVAKLDLKGNYSSMENFYEAIKDIKFDAGLPALVKHGFNQVIVFPEQDRKSGMDHECRKGKISGHALFRGGRSE